MKITIISVYYAVLIFSILLIAINNLVVSTGPSCLIRLLPLTLNLSLLLWIKGSVNL